jgi:hypothetical protein
MKNFKYSYVFLSFILGLLAWGCSVEQLDPTLEERRNEAFDLIVLSDDNKIVPVAFTATATNLEKVTVNITAKGSEEVVATTFLRNITHTTLNRISLKVPFPENDKAPSGIYTVHYVITTKAGQTSTGEYDINIINNMSPVLCDFTKQLPAGKTVWLRLYVPGGAELPEATNKIYATGSFGTREGGSSWDGGGGANNPFTFTRISETCYELALNLQSGDEFKITRGSWASQMYTAAGTEPGNTSYNGESDILFTIYNWGDLPKVTPSAPAVEILNIPAEAVKPGMLTFVATLDASLRAGDGDYYVIEKGATNLSTAVKMTAFDGSNKVAAAVAKKSGVEYIVVKASADATGRNRYGFEQSANWDGKTNPVQVTVGTFGPPAFALGNKIVIVGGATPGDWGVSSGQDFTKTAEGKYSITIALKANQEYLLLPDYNQWGDKWAYASGTALEGKFDRQGSGNNFTTTGLAEGSYKIEVDFTKGTGSYKLTKQ